MNLYDINIEVLDSKGNQIIARNYKTKEILLVSNGYKIVYIKDSNVFLDKNYWRFSQSIENWRNKILRENTQSVENKVESGEYKLINLNN